MSLACQSSEEYPDKMKARHDKRAKAAPAVKPIVPVLGVSANLLPGLDDAHLLYEHLGQGVLYGVGPIPPFTIYEQHDSVKLVVSTFNAEVEVEELENTTTIQGLKIRLRADVEKSKHAIVFNSSIGPATCPSGELTVGTLVAILGTSFSHEIGIEEFKHVCEITLPKRHALVIKRTRTTSGGGEFSPPSPSADAKTAPRPL